MKSEARAAVWQAMEAQGSLQVCGLKALVIGLQHGW